MPEDVQFEESKIKKFMDSLKNAKDINQFNFSTWYGKAETMFVSINTQINTHLADLKNVYDDLSVQDGEFKQKGYNIPQPMAKYTDDQTKAIDLLTKIRDLDTLRTQMFEDLTQNAYAIIDTTKGMNIAKEVTDRLVEITNIANKEKNDVVSRSLDATGKFYDKALDRMTEMFNSFAEIVKQQQRILERLADNHIIEKKEFDELSAKIKAPTMKKYLCARCPGIEFDDRQAYIDHIKTSPNHKPKPTEQATLPSPSG